MKNQKKYKLVEIKMKKLNREASMPFWLYLLIFSNLLLFAGFPIAIYLCINHIVFGSFIFLFLVTCFTVMNIIKNISFIETLQKDSEYKPEQWKDGS